MQKYSQNTLIFSLIVIINLVAHYIPFIRYSISSDDYSFLNKKFILLENFIKYSERPLQYLWIDLQNYVVFNNYIIGSLLNLFSNIFLLFSIYLIFQIIFKNNYKFIFTCLLFISLFFTRTEIFHYPIYIYINLISSVYILCIYFFIKFIRYQKYKFYYYSLFFYTLGIFGYEIGFFIPFSLFILYFHNKSFKFIIFIKIFGFFLLISIFYLIFRFTNSFGFSSIDVGRSVSFNILYSIKDIFNIFLGRYMIKYIIYGFYQFFTFKISYIFILLLINFFLSVLINNYIQIRKIKIEKKYLYFFFSLFLVALIPNLLVGSIGGRNISISLMGITPLFLFIIYKFNINKNLIIFIIFISLIINQGNNFSQVISSKINFSLFNYINANKNIIFNNENIIIDTDSFKKNIKFSLINNKNNNFNYFYTAQLFDSWGISGMLHLINSFNHMPQLFVSSSYIKINDHVYEFKTLKNSGYREFNIIDKSVSKKNTFIIDYKSVYDKKYNYGFNKY